MITKKSKGGKGKAETLRNEAVLDLHKTNPHKWNAYKIGKLLERDTKTIIGIIETYAGSYPQVS